MAGNWNPNYPGAFGLEWFPTSQALATIQYAPTRAQVLRSTGAQTVTALRFGIGPTINQSNPESIQCDILDMATLATSAAAKNVEYAPNADVSIGAWTNQAGGTVNIFGSIDDPVVYPPTGTDDIRTFSTSPTAYEAHVASAAFSLTAQVCRLTMRAVIGNVVVSSNASRGFVFRLTHIPSGAHFSVDGQQFSQPLGNIITSDFGEINPQSGLPWSPADVRSFDIGGNWAIRVESVANAACGARVISMSLQVTYMDTDPRLAVGVYARAAGQPGPIITTDQLAHLSAGAWVANWSKPASGDHLYFLRRSNAKAVYGAGATQANDLRWAFARDETGIVQANPPPVPGMRSLVVSYDTNGRLTAIDQTNQPHVTGRLDLIVGGVVADDSQPYRIDYDGLTGTSRRDVSSAGTYVAQRLTPTSNQSYLGVRFVTAPPADDTATLTVTIRRVSDNLQFGGTLVVSAADVRKGPQMPNAPGFYYVEGLLSAGGALVSGTQYEIRFDPTVGAGSSALAWSFMAGLQDGSPSANVAGFKGSADGIIDDGVADATFDIGAQLIQQPAAPSAVEARVIPVAQSGDGAFCTVPFIDQVVLLWQGTSLGASFLRYEIERLEDDDGVTWTPVAYATKENLNEFVGTTRNFWPDRQVRRNRQAKYRVRVISTAGAFSNWTESDFVSPRSYGAEVIFTSNVDPTIELVYCREPAMAFVDMNDDTDELLKIYGAYGSVAFSEPEDRGLQAQMTITANFGRMPTDDLDRPIGAQAVFAPLRAVARAVGRVPYVCVLDHEGNRVFGRVQLTTLDYTNPGSRYPAQVTVTPLTLDNGIVVLS